MLGICVPPECEPLKTRQNFTPADELAPFVRVRRAGSKEQSDKNNCLATLSLFPNGQTPNLYLLF